MFCGGLRLRRLSLTRAVSEFSDAQELQPYSYADSSLEKAMQVDVDMLASQSALLRTVALSGTYEQMYKRRDYTPSNAIVPVVFDAGYLSLNNV